MSYSVVPLKPVLVEIPEIRLTTEKEWAVLKGSKANIQMDYPTQTSNSQSVSFIITPPNIHSVIDRAPTVSFPVRLILKATSTGAGQTVIVPHQFSLNSFPVSHATATLNSQINSSQFNIQLSQCLPPLLRYNNGAALTVEDYSLSPSMQPQTADYDMDFGGIRSVNAGYLDCNAQSIMGNAGFPMTIVQLDVSTGSGQNLTAIVDFVSTEYVFLSPWLQGKSRGPGFYNITQLLFSWVMQSNAGYFMINQDATSVGIPMTITSAQVQFSNFTGAAWSYPSIQVPTMHMKFYSLPEDIIVDPQQQFVYPYSEIRVFPTQGSLASQNVSTTIASQTVTFSAVPDYIMLWVQEWQNGLIASPSRSKDSFFAIDKISCLFNDQDGQLASSSPQALYQMCCRNGLKMDWPQWSGQGILKPDWSGFIYGAGSPLLLAVPSDITVNSSLLAPGSPMQVSFQCTVTCRNLSSSNVMPMLYIMPIFAGGVFTITGVGSSTQQLGVASMKDIINAREISQMPSADYADVVDVLKQGSGDFFSSLKNIGKAALHGVVEYGPKVNSFLRDTKALSTLTGQIPHPYAQIASQGLKRVGYGKKPRRKKAGVVLGGGPMSREDLIRMSE